jgi:hypothetical protein
MSTGPRQPFECSSASQACENENWQVRVGAVSDRKDGARIKNGPATYPAGARRNGQALMRAGHGRTVYISGMLDPVKWRVAISCPLCGSTGSAILSESGDEPPRARRIEVLSQGFIGTVTGSPPTTIFLCAGCQIPAFSKPQGVLEEPRQPETRGRHGTPTQTQPSLIGPQKAKFHVV